MSFNLDIVKHWGADVWADLRQTHLAGVAIGLGVLLLAVTAIVLRPGGPPDIHTGYASADAAQTDDISFEIPGQEPMTISDVELSKPRNPFQSVDELGGGSGGGSDEAPSSDSIEDTVTASPAGGGSDSGSSDTLTTTSGSAPNELMPIEDLDTTTTTTTTTGSTDDDGSDGERSSDTTPNGDAKDDEKTEPAPATDYSYAADVQFGVEGSLKRYSNVKRLEFVPSRSNPLLMYLGVKGDHKTAVFMVDSSLSQGGEGNCVPKPSQCTFIEMSTSATRDEHRFRDADGKEYLLRFRGVVRTLASAGSVGGDDVPALPGTPSLVDGTR